MSCYCETILVKTDKKAMRIQVHVILQFYRKVFKSQQSNISFNVLIISIKAWIIYDNESVYDTAVHLITPAQCL